MYSPSKIIHGASLACLIVEMGAVFWMRSTRQRKVPLNSVCFSPADTVTTCEAQKPYGTLRASTVPLAIYHTLNFAGLIHPGILGCAPSAEVLATWNHREGELIAANKLDRDVAHPPLAQNCHAGSADGSTKDKVAKEGARTVPGRPEHGGNCDIKNLSRGSKVYLPVHVNGAKFSVGDLHFSRRYSLPYGIPQY